MEDTNRNFDQRISVSWSQGQCLTVGMRRRKTLVMLTVSSQENFSSAASAVGGFHHNFGCGEVSYLVDPASSHMLVSKIKPCMSKYKQSIQ